MSDIVDKISRLQTVPGDPAYDNALKFIKPGGCVTVRGFAGSGTIGFEVEDNGPGIPGAERDAVQRRFYRTEASRHTPGAIATRRRRR